MRTGTAPTRSARPVVHLSSLCFSARKMLVHCTVPIVTLRISSFEAPRLEPVSVTRVPPESGPEEGVICATRGWLATTNLYAAEGSTSANFVTSSTARRRRGATGAAAAATAATYTTTSTDGAPALPSARSRSGAVHPISEGESQVKVPHRRPSMSTARSSDGVSPSLLPCSCSTVPPTTDTEEGSTFSMSGSSAYRNVSCSPNLSARPPRLLVTSTAPMPADARVVMHVSSASGVAAHRGMARSASVRDRNGVKRSGIRQRRAREASWVQEPQPTHPRSASRTRTPRRARSQPQCRQGRGRGW